MAKHCLLIKWNFNSHSSCWSRMRHGTYCHTFGLRFTGWRCPTAATIQSSTATWMLDFVAASYKYCIAYRDSDVAAASDVVHAIAGIAWELGSHSLVRWTTYMMMAVLEGKLEFALGATYLIILYKCNLILSIYLYELIIIQHSIIFFFKQNF